MDSDRLRDTLARLEARGRERQQKHRADVAHVQQQHPEIAAFLTEWVQAFGKSEVDYRCSLREVAE